MSKEKLPETCIDCPHVIENIEEYEDGGCAWYECAFTGQTIEEMKMCPIVKEEDE